MHNLIEKLAKARILVIGDIMLDRYWWGDVTRISPEAPVPVVHLKKTTDLLGGAANVAANVAGLGSTVSMIGVCGNDADGEVVRALTEANGITNLHIVTTTDRPTTVKTRVMAHGQQIARIDNETARPIDDECLSKIMDKAVSEIENSDAVILSDYAKGVLTNELLAQLISSCLDRNKPVLIDPKGRCYKKYAGATVLTPNRKEAFEASGLISSVTETIDEVGAKLLQNIDVTAVLITQGDEGMSLFQRGMNKLHIPTAARDVYDVTGAGDTVIATLAAAIGAGSDLGPAAELANLAAGIVVEQVGTTKITAGELSELWRGKQLADGLSA